MRQIGTNAPVAPLSHYWHVPPTKSTSLRIAAPLLIALVLALVATVAPATAATKSAARTNAPAVSGHKINFSADTAQTTANERRGKRKHRASYAWAGRKILYTEAIPTKWDWSLSNAIAKWNSVGGGIKFVKAANPRKAKLTIAYGNIGGAAGLATVGRTRHASVRLNSSYSAKDALNAHNRIEVLGIFTHELGHVLGFQHTSTRCSLMSPVLDVDGCGVLPPSLPGYYKCRTIDGPLAARFVRLYGGHVRSSSPWCLIDPLPAPVSRVAFAGGTPQQAATVGGDSGSAARDDSSATRSPVTITWATPGWVPAGSRVAIRSWEANSCGAVPDWAFTQYASIASRVWHDSQAEDSGSTCYRVQIVNRYGAGRAAVSHLVS